MDLTVINQNGVKPGQKKFDQFRQAMNIRNVPALYSNDGQGKEAIARVKIFDPCGSWTWYVTEWDGVSECFGLVDGFEAELGYFDLKDLATQKGIRGIGLEIDVYFEPTPLNKLDIGAL